MLAGMTPLPTGIWVSQENLMVYTGGPGKRMNLFNDFVFDFGLG